MSAWQRVAFVDLLLAILAFVAIVAVACVLVHIVVTEGIVAASVGRQTVVDVLLAVLPCEARLAVALIAIPPVHTGAAILTRTTVTFVNL